MNNSPKRDRALVTINVVIWIFLVTAAAISFSHIVESASALGLDWQSWLAPIFVDGLAIVGKVSMIERFPEPFRRSGRKLLMTGGTLSMAANIYAGHNWGQRGWGVLVVGGFMLLEHHAGKAAGAVAELAKRAKVGTPWSPERRAAHVARKAVVATPAPVHAVQVVSPRRRPGTLGHAQISPITGKPFVFSTASTTSSSN